MGRSDSLRSILGIFAAWVVATVSFTPNVRTTFRIIGGESIDATITESTSSRIFATTEDDASTSIRSRDDPTAENIPGIQELRTSLRKWSKISSREGLTEATNTLRAMFRYHNSSNNSNNNNGNERRPRVDVIDCTQVINAWSKSRQRDAPQQALAILRDMVESFQSNGSSCIRPDGVTYNSVMNAFARRGDLDGASDVFAMQVRDFKENANNKAKPDAYTFSTMINACSRSTRKGVSDTAEKLLATMNDWHAKGDLEGRPSVVTYNSVINCFRKSNEPSKARAILETMLSDDTVRPNKITYNSVLNAHARKGDIRGATEVFGWMKDDLANGNSDARPDVQTYNILIDAWSKSNRDDAPQQAEAVLKEIVRLHSEGSLQEGPDIITYGAVVNCYSKSNLPDAPSMARRVLQTMISEYENGNEYVRPDTVTYAAVMNAHARRGDTKGTKEVFEEMQTDFENGNPKARPNIQNYNILIDAWSKSNSEDAPKQAELVLKEVIQKHSNGLLKGGPDAVTYGAVINCYSKSNQATALSRAREILQTMISEYESTGLQNIRPNTITYATVMDAHARQGDYRGATEVFEMLQQDTNAEPNVQVYTILIDAWSKSKSKDAPMQVASLLQEMVLGTAYSTGTTKPPPTTSSAIEVLKHVVSKYKFWSKSIRPDTFTYNAVMNAFARKGNVDGATEIFELMSRDYRSGHARARVDARSYNILLDAWAKSGRDDALEASEDLLQEMKEKHASGELTEKPDAVTYRTLIQCLEFFEDTEDRVNELQSILSTMA